MWLAQLLCSGLATEATQGLGVGGCLCGPATQGTAAQKLDLALYSHRSWGLVTVEAQADGDLRAATERTACEQSVL